MSIQQAISIKEAYRIGKVSTEHNRPMKIKFHTFQDKMKVLRHSKNLKGKENKDGEKYYINNSLPEVLNEDQKKLKMKVKLNKTLIDAQQQDIQWSRGQLIVDGNKYNPKVVEPTNAEILTMERGTLQCVLAYKTYEGSDTFRNGSKFTGYAAKVHSITDVITAYQQIKYRFLDATHIICAYKIADPDFAHHQDCVNGGEHGAGCRILQMMIDNNFENSGCLHSPLP